MSEQDVLVEQEVVEPILEEALEPSNESEQEIDSTTTEEATQENIDHEEEVIPAEWQEKLGKARSAERKRVRLQYEAQLAQKEEELNRLRNVSQQVMNPGLGQGLQDPITGEYIDVTNPRYHVIARELEVQAYQQRQSQAQQQAELARLQEEFQEKMDQAAMKIANFDHSYDYVNTNATSYIGFAIKQTNIPASIVSYLGKHPNELTRIKSLSPEQQKKEIYKLEDKLQPARKLNSNAPAPIKSVNTSRNTGGAVENQTIEQRREAIKKRLGWT